MSDALKGMLKKALLWCTAVELLPERTVAGKSYRWGGCDW